MLSRYRHLGRLFCIFFLLACVAVGSQGTALAAATTSQHTTGARVQMLAASAGCYGSSCYGWDPYQKSCDQSTRYYVWFTVTDTSGNVLATGANVYSTGCNSNWVIGELSQYSLSHGYTMLLEAYPLQVNTQELVCFPGTNQNNGGAESCYNYWVWYGGGGVAWSDMVDGTGKVHTCVFVTTNQVTGDGRGACVDQ